MQKSALPYHLSNNSYSTLRDAIIASQISIIIYKKISVLPRSTLGSLVVVRMGGVGGG